MLEEAISHYHSLLDDAMARETQAQLDQHQRDRGLFFGDRPLANVLRPRFISLEQYWALRTACNLVVSAANTLAAEMLRDLRLRARVGLTPAEERLIAIDPGYAEPSAHSRMDTFLSLDGRSLQFVEYNAESPAAIAYEDALSEVFLQLPVMHEFAKQYTISALPARQRLLTTLLRAWKNAQAPAPPTIAIVDWYNLPTRFEFLLCQRYFAEQGVDSVICSPDDLVYHEGRLYARGGQTNNNWQGDFPITIVYKRVLTAELLTHYGESFFDHPLYHAYAAHAVCMVNSFRAKLLHKKAIFALLTDESLQSGFTANEQSAIRRCVPWTRMLTADTTTYQGKPVQIHEFARNQRERLILKPNDDYGGRGITIGWESTPEQWDNALAAASHSPHVIQERVEIAYEAYPSLVNGQLEVSRRLVDSDPFLFGTDVQGCLTRLSTVTLLNVTAGGGSTVPAFVIEPTASANSSEANATDLADADTQPMQLGDAHEHL